MATIFFIIRGFWFTRQFLSMIKFIFKCMITFPTFIKIFKDILSSLTW